MTSTEKRNLVSVTEMFQYTSFFWGEVIYPFLIIRGHIELPKNDVFDNHLSRAAASPPIVSDPRIEA